MEGGEIVSARIEDVAPTVLYLLGEPIPVELEGRLLVEAIEPDVLDGGRLSTTTHRAPSSCSRSQPSSKPETRSRSGSSRVGYLE